MYISEATWLRRSFVSNTKTPRSHYLVARRFLSVRMSDKQLTYSPHMKQLQQKNLRYVTHLRSIKTEDAQTTNMPTRQTHPLMGQPQSVLIFPELSEDPI